MVEVMATGMGAKLQKTTRNWLGLSDRVTCRGSFSSPPGAYPPPPPGTFLQLFNRATTLDACQLHDCVVAAERGGTQPQMGQILRYTERQLVSNHLTTDIIGADAGQWGIQSCCILQS